MTYFKDMDYRRQEQQGKNAAKNLTAIVAIYSSVMGLRFISYFCAGFRFQSGNLHSLLRVWVECEPRSC